ncbi:C40 family peptidase [Geomobilimonas luticola]|uniref:C40 family peptidase n=1 Tax=Geomobilimonas luticola TaxID=1114878 RepID=A0ABS5SES1_9BACT|nr:C40 family peptidase [Geomobilimonas luticola]MBT0653861.1 C40 family peptidase [Geomobilimonas luticola]
MKKSSAIVWVCLVFVMTFPSLVFAAKTHRVKRNETLHAISKKYHVTVADLKTANNLVHNQVKKGDTLVIPLRSAGVNGKKAAAGTYRVKKGDNFSRIAKKTGVSLSELKRLNPSTKGRLKVGQDIALRDADAVEDEKPRIAKASGVYLKNNDLFSEKDYEQSLADLTEADPSKPVDLTKNLELKTDNVTLLKSKAYGFLGTRYRFGGSSRNGIDCSSFVQQVFREMEVSLPRTAREQFEVGNEVSPGDLQKGDLVFFRTYARFPSHVGIYLGGNKMIHASSRDRRVVISTMDTPYYRARFLGAKRIGKINPQVFKWDDLLSGVEEEMADDAQANDALGISLNNN